MNILVYFILFFSM